MVPPNVVTTVASQSITMVTQIVAAINAFLSQPVKDASLKSLHADFVRRLRRVGLMLDAVREAPPVVAEYHWETVEQLDELIKEARAVFAPEAGSPIGGNQQGDSETCQYLMKSLRAIQTLKGKRYRQE